MKKDILYALDVLIKQDELGATNSKKLNTIIPLIDNDGSITKEQTIEMLFTQSTNPDVAYRAFVNRIKEALEVSLSSDTLSTIDKEVLESLKVEIVKKRGDSPAHIYFEAKAKRKIESYIKENDNYRDEEYVNSRGDTGEIRESKKENIKLFISYAHNDKFVASIFEGIFKEFTKDTEIGYWIDDDIELGKDFDISIKEALKSCDYGLCLISQSFLDSKYITQTELTYFLDNDNILPIGLSSKIDGKPSNSFFSEVSKKYNDNQKIMDMLKKQIYTLKGIGDNIFFEKTIDQEYKDNFIKGLISEIEKKIAKKKEQKQEQKKYNVACYNPLNDKRYKNSNFELNHGSHISFDKEIEEKKNIEKVAVLDSMLAWATSSYTPPIYALLGDYGMGKTFNCRKFAYELSKLSESDNSIQRAIYIDLREIDTFIINSEGNTVIPPLESILSQILKSRKSFESVEEIISDVTDGKSIIIFDGLDEKIVHYTKEMETKFLSELMSIMPSHTSPAKMVLSCRTHHFEDIYAQNGFFRELDRGKRSDNYQAVTILPFDTVQISSFLTKVLPREDAKKAIALIESEKYLKEIVSRPYLLDKVSASITSIVALQNRGEIINSASFYQTIIQDTLIRDEEKHSIPRRAKIELLQSLAFKMWQGGHQILKIDELNDWLHEWIGDNPKRSIRDIVTQSSWRQLETDLRNTTLLIRFGDEDFGFSHSSMMEYFLSQYALEHWEEIAGAKEFSTLSRQFLLDSTINLKTKEKELLLPKLIESAENTSDSYWVKLSLDMLSLLGLHIENLTLTHAKLPEYKFKNFNIKNLTLEACELYASEWLTTDIDKLSPKTSNLSKSYWEDSKVNRLLEDDSSHLKEITLYNSTLPIDTIHDFSKDIREKSQIDRLSYGHNSSITSIAFSPNGEKIVSGSGDNTLKLWNTRGECLATFEGHSGIVVSVCFSPNGEQIVSGSDDNTLRLWNTRGECLATFEGHSGIVASVCFSPNGEQIVSGSGDSTLKLWNTRGECLATFEGHSNWVNSVCFSPNGEQIVSGSYDNTLKLWNTRGECLATFEGHSEIVISVCFSPNGEQIVSGSLDNTLKLWNTRGECLATFEGHSGRVASVCFSPNGEQIVSGSGDNTLRLWNTRGECLATFEGHSDWVTSVCFSPNGEQIVSGSGDSTLKLWNTRGECLATFEGHSNWVNSVCFSPNGEQIVSGSGDKTLKLWNTRGECLATFEGHSGYVTSVCFSPNGEQIVSGSIDNTLRLWNTRGECLATFEGHSEIVTSVCFSPNGEQIVSGSLDNTLKLWSTRGECLATFDGHSDWVSSVCFSSNGEQIVSGSFDYTLKLWNTRGECLATFEGHSNTVSSVCFSPNGEQIVSGSRDNTLRLWNTRGECLATFEGHSNTVSSVCFSPNGEQIVSGSRDNTLRLWNTRGECLATFEGHSEIVNSVCFSPNGEQIVSGSDDGSMRVWDIEPPKELSRMHHLDSEWYSFDLENQTAKGTPMSWKLSTLSDSEGETFRIDALRGFEVYPYMDGD